MDYFQILNIDCLTNKLSSDIIKIIYNYFEDKYGCLFHESYDYSHKHIANREMLKELKYIRKSYDFNNVVYYIYFTDDTYLTYYIMKKNNDNNILICFFFKMNTKELFKFSKEEIYTFNTKITCKIKKNYYIEGELFKLNIYEFENPDYRTNTYTLEPYVEIKIKTDTINQDTSKYNIYTRDGFSILHE
jgi:hypothetical protein